MSDDPPRAAPEGADTYGAPVADVEAPGDARRDPAAPDEPAPKPGAEDEDEPPAPPPSAPPERTTTDAEPEPTAPPETPAKPDPGPPPASTCTVDKDKDGFFWRTSSKSPYVAYVPASYTSKAPMRVVVGLHGCGDDALNFAKWGVNPWDTRQKQEHIGISVSGETGANRCWSMGRDDDKVLAAVDDLASCFWVDRSRVVVAGYSSGGQLAYRVGLLNAPAFAGILIENSSLYAAGAPPNELIAGAAWKVHVAHRAHTGDSVFPIAKVREDWAKLKAAGFPVVTSELAGSHEGLGTDWAEWLLPQSASWTRPSL